MKSLLILAALLPSMAVAQMVVNPFRFAAAAPATDLPPKSAVIAWYACEVAGSAVDSTGSNTMAYNTGNPPTTTGKVSNGFSMAGANRYYMLDADAADFEFGDADFSFAGWIRLDSGSATRGVLGKWGSLSTREWAIYTTSSNEVRFGVSGNGADATTVTSAVISLSTWYFVYAEYDSVADQIRVSLNGGSKSSSAFSGALFNGGSDVNLGMINNGSFQYFNGALDEIAMFSRTLTTDEVAALYNSGAGVTYTDLP